MKFKDCFKLRSRKANNKNIKSEEKLIEEIRKISWLIDNAYLQFDMLRDDATIYELEALKSRQRYLLRLARTKNISCEISPLSVYERI